LLIEWISLIYTQLDPPELHISGARLKNRRAPPGYGILGPHRRKSMLNFLGADFTVTKRQLGIVLVVAGIAVVIGTLAVEWINGGPTRFGTVQKMALLLGTLCAATGLTLLPLGSRPA
jgi:hypothetical protein